MIKPTAQLKKAGKVLSNSATNAIEKERVLDLVRRMEGGHDKVYIGVPVGAAPEENGTPMAVVAAAHEFGAPSRGIPERSFLRVSLTMNAEKYVNFNRALMPRIINGQIGFEQALGLLGEMAKGDVQRFIATNTYQLKPATIKRKGSSKALIDTGNMRQSITWVLDPNDKASA